MADVTLNGSSVIRGRLALKRRGNWTAFLDELSMDAPPTGQVTLRWLGTDCQGTVLRSGLADGIVSAVVIGGRGAGSKQLPAKMYDFGLPVRMVLDDILSDAGEVLSSTADQAVLARSLARYVRLAGDLGHQLDQLADRVGAVWRFLPDGSVWFGIDAWPAAPGFEHELLAEWSPASSVVPLAPEALGALPGTTYTGPPNRADLATSVRVGTACYEISPDRSTASLYAVNSQAPGDESQLSQSLRRIVREETQDRDFDRVYTGKVIQQRADGTLDIDMADKRLPALTSVQTRATPPKSRVTVPPGVFADVVFEDGDLERAVAVGYSLAGAEDQTKAVARVDDTVAIGSIVFSTVADGVLTGTYTDPSGAPTNFTLGTPFTIRGKITSGFSGYRIPAG